MKIIKISFFTGMPFYICSLFAVYFKYTTPRGGFIDLSGVEVLIIQVCIGIAMLFANLLLFMLIKSMCIISNNFNYHTKYIIAYIFICIFTHIFIKAFYSYSLAFYMPIIILVYTYIINIISYIINKPQNDEFAFDKKHINFTKITIFVIIIISLICACVSSTYKYYKKWESCKNWALRIKITSFEHEESKYEILNMMG